MSSESYEEQTLSAEQTLGDAVFYLQDQMKVEITTYNGDPIGVELPQTVVLYKLLNRTRIEGRNSK